MRCGVASICDGIFTVKEQPVGALDFLSTLIFERMSFAISLPLLRHLERSCNDEAWG